MLINPGDTILTENPSYLGAIQAFTAYQAQYVTVPIDDDGLQVAQLEAALRTGPKFMYILPNFQNPAGVTLSLTRRYDLIALAEEYGIPIVEDDPYGQLRFEGEHLKPLVVLDSEYEGCTGVTGYTGNVIYTSTFSKTLAPGLRLGWIVAPRDVVSKIVQMKQGTDLQTSTFDQMVAYQVARGGFLDQHVRRIREVYRGRRDLMIQDDGRKLPGRRHLDSSAGRSVLVGHDPGIHQHRRLAERRHSAEGGVRARPFIPPHGRRAQHHAPELQQRHRRTDRGRHPPVVGRHQTPAGAARAGVLRQLTPSP